MQMDGLGAIVTGGASGLGGATVDMLVAAGAKVTIFDRNAALAEEKAAAVGCRFAALDVTDPAAVSVALDEAEAVNGRTRILVSCAGIGPPGKVIGRDGTPIPLTDFAAIINVNLIGTFNVLSQVGARLAGSARIGEEAGVFINTASVAAFDGQIGQAAYAASKAGIVGMTLPIAREFARWGIRVMTIAPGLFMTPLLATLPQEAQDSLGRQVPFPSRLGDPAEYARLVRSIIDNPMLNGEVIRLDGAIRMAPK
ncbi:SDR family NAD(P)-dependent oxidoreductase [Segnochrobactraceae bacterium EtOH-i3]